MTCHQVAGGCEGAGKAGDYPEHAEAALIS